MSEVVLGIGLFVTVVLVLTVVVMIAHSLLVAAEAVTVTVNGSDRIDATTGERLLAVLAGHDLQVPSPCGGAGTCGQCRVTVTAGGGEVLPTEAARLSRAEIRSGLRLACQVIVRSDAAVTVSDEILGARTWECTVSASRTVAPLIRELVLELPPGSEIEFRAGAFVQVDAPPYRRSFADFEIAPEHRQAWGRLRLAGLTAVSERTASRAYSVANTPATGTRCIVLLVRLALPPPSAPEARPGVVSSYLFGLRVGDKVQVSGPFGHFGICESKREMVFIGGGVGMAPLRAMITDELENRRGARRMSFWYGARSAVDLFYREEFDRLVAEHDNFHWTAALSDAAPDDAWSGPTGFIHTVVFERYLKDHPAPEECEYYLCGPPLMITAVLAMLEDVGVDPARIFNDDFGG